MTGAVFIVVGFLGALSATVLYFRSTQIHFSKVLFAARTSYLTAVTAQVLASFTLLYLILSHQFQYTYVWSYSSTTLPLPLLASSFYAGQEGSFMLWTLFLSLLGVLLLRSTSKNDHEPAVMAVYSFILSFLFLMLLFKSPFSFIWETYPQDVIHQGLIPAGMTRAVWLDRAKELWVHIPEEGRGLNPALQNYWMVIHPQILFMGFSSMAIPFAFAVGALLKKEYTGWVRYAMPWSIFGSMVLGTGIILGGYWAYETLGWGGFWGWDPVENSSLIPWLVCVASLHTMLVQRNSGAFVRTNFALSMLAFLLVLYSTFLTRSGVLGDTSVHSFVEPGMWVYGLLVAFMLVFISLGAGLFFLRLKDMPKVPVQHSALSREFVLFLGAVVLTAIALVVLLGTSAPLLLSIFHQKAAAMDAAFYAKTNLPLGIVLAVLAGVGQWLSWKDSSAQSLARRLLWPFVLAACATILVSFLGDLEIITGLFICASAFAAISNAFLAADVLKMNPKLSGGVLAHIGIALMFIGFVTSSRFSEKQTLSLERGKSTSAYGYQLTYTGYNQRPDGKYAMGIEVQSGMTLYTATPLMFSGEQAENIMRVPDIVRFISRDLYLEPVSVEDSSAAAPGQLMKLSKDVPGEFNGLRLRFTGYDFSTEQRSAMMAGKPFEMNASLVVAEGMKETTLQLKMQSAEGAMTMVPAPYTAKDGQRYEFAIGKMFPAGEKEKAALELAITTGTSSAVGHGETLIVEATIKPFIGLVWTGTFVLVIGFALALRRRVIEARGV